MDTMLKVSDSQDLKYVCKKQRKSVC